MQSRKQLDDPELARHLLDGDEQAFDRFVAVYRGKLVQYSYLMCGQKEDAEEVAQETLMRVFQNLDQLRDPERLKPWVFRIARNACLMKRRKSLFAPDIELSLDELRPLRQEDGDMSKLDIADWSMVPETVVSDAEIRAALIRAIQQLPAMYRSAVLLRDIEELTTQETAEILDVTIDVVKSRLHRARLALRREMDNYLKTIRGTEHDRARV